MACTVGHEKAGNDFLVGCAVQYHENHLKPEWLMLVSEETIAQRVQGHKI